MAPTVLFEDNHLLVVDKPVGLTTQGAVPGEPSVVEWARRYVKQKYAKPGNVYIGIVSRLDRDVSGVLPLARTSKAAARLNEQFRERSVEKLYWAVVEGAVPAEGRYVDRIAKDERLGRMTIVGDDDDGAEAVLTFRTLQKLVDATLVEVRLETGRKHQIRVQMAEHGHAIVGDRRYGSRRDFPAGIALHARQIVFEHPTRRESMKIAASLPKSWQVFRLDESAFG